MIRYQYQPRREVRQMSEEPTEYNKYEVSKVINLDMDEFKLEKIFGVFKQLDSKHFYFNILNKINFPAIPAADTFNSYYTTPQDTWTVISYKHYSRIDLWWLIASFNQIDNTFIPPVPGTRLKIPTPDTVRYIIDQIKARI